MSSKISKHESILKALAIASQRILQSQNYEHAIVDLIKDIGLASSVSRVSIMQCIEYLENDTVISQLYEWTAPGISKQINNPILQNMSLVKTGFGNERELLFKGEIVSALIKDLDISLRNLLTDHSILSMAIAPIFVKDVCWGFIGFDDCLEERNWSEAEQDALKASAGLLGAIVHKNEMEIKLKQSEDTVKEISANMPGVLFQIRLNKNNKPFVSYLSQSYKDLFHISSDVENMDLNQFYNIIKPSNLDFIEKSILESIKFKNGWDFEYKLSNERGLSIWIRESTFCSINKNLEVIWNGVATDITNIRKSIDELKVSQTRLEDAQKLGNIGNFEYHLKTGEKYWSNQLYDMFKREKKLGPVATDDLDMYIEKKELDKLKTEFLDAINDNRQFSIELMCKNMLEETLYLRATIKQVLDNKLNIEKIVGTIQNITENSEIVLALKESEQKYLSHFMEDLAGNYVSSVSGKLIYCNPAFAKMFGFSSPESAYERNSVYLYQSSTQRSEMIKLIKIHKKLENYEITLIRLDGSPIHIIETIVGKFDDYDNLIELRGYVIDITERKHLEEQLRSSQKMESIATLASGVAHDFNNILSIISGNATLIKVDPDFSEKQAKYVESILKASDRGAGVVKQLLTFAKETEFQTVEISVNAEVSEFVNMIKETFPKMIDFHVKLAPHHFTINADKSQFHQILLNLFINARDALLESENQKDIIVITELKDKNDLSDNILEPVTNQYISLTISDTGHGMDEKTISRIFEPFYTTKASGKGTGLGLAVVYGIVNSLHGHIFVESKIGFGTTFKLLFPYYDKSETQKETKVLPGDSLLGRDEGILLIEDELALLDLIEIYLKSKNYRIYTATDGLDALKVFKSHADSIDLVISDFQLPNFDGLEAVQFMKKLKPSIKVIMASGYYEDAMKSKILSGGVDFFISKPYDLNHLLTIIRQSINK